MKLFALLLLFAAVLLVAAIEDQEIEKCGDCYDSDKSFVCAQQGPTVGTFYNKCVMKCMQAVYLYDGECKNKDLLDSKLEAK